MDLSELQLKLNKEKPISDLKVVEQQLNKTGSAADNLIDTLKNVGISIGFGKLLKDTLSLNSSFDALNNKFNSIFKSGFDENVFSQLKEDITVSDSALKNILSTTGQFAAGMNQSSQFVRQFSADLTKAAADYATYQGKNTSSEINDYARKFAKATLGEVGELKEIGIVIDTTSKQFKNAVTEFAMLNGVTEEQAKQQLIFKEILKQTEIAAGSASGNINDGWAQLNKTFDVFKEILAQVGKIFSDTFGPILRVLNSILEIPFVKSTTAWVIALGSFTFGYVTLIKTISVLNKTLLVSNGLFRTLYSDSEFQKFIDLQTEHKNLIKEQNKLYEKQEKLQEKLQTLKYDKEKFDFLKNEIKKGDLSAKEELRGVGSDPTRQIFKTERELKNLDDSLKDIDASLKNVSNEAELSKESFERIVSVLGDKVNPEFGKLLASLGIFRKSLILTTAATYGQIAANKLLAISQALSTAGSAAGGAIKGIGSLFKGLFGLIAKIFAPLTVFFKSFWTTAVTISGGALKAVGALTSSLGILIGSVVIVFDSIKMLWNLVTGKEWNKGTITNYIAENWFNWFTHLDEAEEESKEIDEKIKKIMEPLNEIKNLRKELEELQLERKIKDLLPREAVKEYEKRASELRKSITDAYAIIEQLKKDSRKKDDESLINDKRDAQEKLLNLTKQLYDTEDKISDLRKKQIEIDKEYIKSMEEIRKKISGVSESFNYGYKNGKFGNYTEDAKYQNTLNSLDKFSNMYFLSDVIKDTTEEGLNTAKEKLNEFFDLIKSKNEYELNALNKQREAAISTFEKTKEILNSISGYRVTAQTAISANTTEAIKLQSRRFESMTENRQLIQEQKQIKEIELKMLEKQKESKTTLEKIGNKLSEITNKIGKAQGANINIVPAL